MPSMRTACWLGLEERGEDRKRRTAGSAIIASGCAPAVRGGHTCSVSLIAVFLLLHRWGKFYARPAEGEFHSGLSHPVCVIQGARADAGAGPVPAAGCLPARRPAGRGRATRDWARCG